MIYKYDINSMSKRKKKCRFYFASLIIDYQMEYY